MGGSRNPYRDPTTQQFLARDLTGLVCNKLTVLERTAVKYHLGYPVWRARCECGNVIERPSYRFTNKRYKIRDCGCGPLGRPRIANNGAHVNSIYAHVRRSAIARGIAFSLTRDDVRTIVTKNCRYCDGAPPRRQIKNLSGTFAWNGIDRIDSSLGYAVDNCAPCCPRCNWAKGTLSLVEFGEWAERITSHLPTWRHCST